MTSRRRWRLTGQFVKVSAVMMRTKSPGRAVMIRSLAPTLSERMFRQIRMWSKRKAIQWLDAQSNGAVDFAFARDRAVLSLLAQDLHR